MMDESIADACLVDIAWLGVVDCKRIIRTVPIRLLHKLIVKIAYIIEQSKPELRHVLTPTLSTEKLTPCA